MRPALAPILTLTAVLLLAGCAALRRPLPADITRPPPRNLQLTEVQADIRAYRGAHVRWGGTVVQVAAAAGGATRVEILDRTLDAAGRPIMRPASNGRFIVEAAPKAKVRIYRIGSLVTVAGVVGGAARSSLGRRVPVVRVAHVVRWRWQPSSVPAYPCYGSPWWYGMPWHAGPWLPCGSRLDLRYGWDGDSD